MMTIEEKRIKRRIWSRNWRLANPEKARASVKKSMAKNFAKYAEKRTAGEREYRIKNRANILARQLAWRERNRQRERDRSKARREANPEKHKKECRDLGKKMRAQRTEYARNKKHSDIQFKLRCVLRGRLKQAVSKNQRGGCAITDLGCSISELVSHLESKFREGMNWSNHGQYGWHIDHIVPLASFDLTNPDHVKKACHFTNLQPLWASENLFKKAKLTHIAVAGISQPQSM